MATDYLGECDIDRSQAVALELWNTNRILQPRLQGLHRHRQPESSVWIDIFPTAISDNGAVKTAWENYRMLIHMIENVNNDAIEVFK